MMMGNRVILKLDRTAIIASPTFFLFGLEDFFSFSVIMVDNLMITSMQTVSGASHYRMILRVYFIAYLIFDNETYHTNNEMSKSGLYLYFELGFWWLILRFAIGKAFPTMLSGPPC
ncbi:hypothetical protein BPAE_0003g01750 [Botrytis paeoniae]|uniref:Uncharacterized protein n=1 Tax=Botrytis paeoniae TaxID=278948 RepID=A0A4Z1G782_9HELO|nr:hypothetical protein BPAE_0003g01750 [Botrytis paeoniae]